ncbi:Xaa-Pro dipeptidyl-peptidase [Spirillospora sp. CA-294931]|uniref:Xaa-Pro dipeptidyl-peptidase n=1 Tax=Spirillospora sp. CA-294931 TaxID=3240042 RepID=UPI003D8F9B42
MNVSARSAAAAGTTAALVLAIAPAAAAAPPRSEPAADRVQERVYVESTVDSDRDGRPDRIAIDIVRPDTSAKVPVVFEHSPYRGGIKDTPFHNVNVDRLPQEGLFPGADRGRGATRTKGATSLAGWLDSYFVPRGYGVVYGHSIGTGASEGCPTSGDKQETLGTTAVIDWLNGRARGFRADGSLVTASWSTGKVGMTGVSYDGTLPNMAAATGVEGLRAIVPIAAISSFYDYYRANGLVVAPGGWQGEDADILARAVVDRTGCGDEIGGLTTGQDRVSGDYNDFWRARDQLPLASQVKAGVFVMHGHSDWNVKGKQYAMWWDALRRHSVPRKIWLHRGGHGPPSRQDYMSTMQRWFDYWVKGIDNGVTREPLADVQYADGSWKTYADWPDPAARPVTLHASATSATAPGSLATSPSTGELRQTFTDQGRTRRASSLVASPDAADANRLVYRTGALPAAVRLSGSPQVRITGAVENRGDANLTALLVDYDRPGGTSAPVIVSRGWLDPQNRNSPASGEKVVQGQEYDLRFDMQPKDHVFAAGRRIGLVVISTDYDYTLRPQAGTRLRLHPAQTSVTLPSVGLAAR